MTFNMCENIQFELVLLQECLIKCIRKMEHRMEHTKHSELIFVQKEFFYHEVLSV